LVDDRLVEYIRNTIKRGYDEKLIKEAILNRGYSAKDYNEALRKLVSSDQEIKEIKDHKAEIRVHNISPAQNNKTVADLTKYDAKRWTVIIYTIISLTLGLFALNYLGLSISKNAILDYIVIGLITVAWAYFVYYIIKKIVDPSLYFLGYFVQLSVIIDLLVNKKISNIYVGIVIVLFLYTLSYFTANVLKVFEKE
jgi:hypothetical protein